MGASVMTIGIRVALGLVLVAVVGFVFRLASGTDDDRPLSEAKAGDCLNLNDAAQDEVETYKAKSCDKEHLLEVIGNVSHPEGKGQQYPGEEAVEAFAQAGCEAIFPGYVGIPYEESRLVVSALYPTSESWDIGDRRSICVVTSGDSPTLDKTVRGARV
jgi:hypothetical protein